MDEIEIRQPKLIKVTRMSTESSYITSSIDANVKSALTEMVKDPQLQFDV